MNSDSSKRYIYEFFKEKLEEKKIRFSQIKIDNYGCHIIYFIKENRFSYVMNYNTLIHSLINDIYCSKVISDIVEEYTRRKELYDDFNY